VTVIDEMALNGGRFGAAVVAGAALWACGSGGDLPSGVQDNMPDARTTDALGEVDAAQDDARTDGSADAGEGGSQDATEASVDEADAREPPFCFDEGGPVHPDPTTAPAQASGGVCPSTIHRAISTITSEGVTIRFVGLTPDARTLAWFESGTLNYADRADATSAWSPGHSVDGVTPGPDRPALSADGLRIVVVKADRHGFAEYTRLDRQTRFGSDPSETQFSAINGVGVMLGTNEWLGSPVLSSDDRMFIYLRGEAIDQRHDAVYASTRSSNVTWPLGVAVHAVELDAICGRYRRPTALSSDALTLFYWDEVAGAERATFRSLPGGSFAGSIDLGDAADAVPNAACTVAYFTAAAGGVSSAGFTP
jgi:hypothetical protein